MNHAVLAILVSTVGALPAAAQWLSADGPLMTRWSKEVSPERVHPEYPRPQMVRPDWQNLNGLWEYAIRPKSEDRPAQFDGRILVPFPVESALSGVMKRVEENQRLWYRRTFEVPAGWSDRNVLLHFGAVDWEATVWVNQREVGTHRGGYDPFSFDITEAIGRPGRHELVVAVWDPTDAGHQPRGKQVHKPGSIWYTPTTGIWQTVWLEPVPPRRIENLVLTPELGAPGQTGKLVATVTINRPMRSDTADVIVLDGGKEVARASGMGKLEVGIPNPKLWSPDNPFLYELRVVLRRWDDPQAVLDQVTSYFGMRKISVGPDERGITRLMLNGKPLFMYGTLDQGFWPDGLYTAPTDEALRFDIEVLKKLGFNMTRKHVKIEPERWYYWCDRLGLLVWQDMPSGDKDPNEGEKEIKRSKESAEQFELELRRMIDARRNHPCIVMWVPFNEGWGQYDTQRIVTWVKEYDPSRLVNNASGWHDFGAGDVIDVHKYPGPEGIKPEPKRAAVLGEFGGLGLPLTGHTWQQEKNWGYRSFTSRQELTEAYVNLLAALKPLIADPGLSAAVYTQTSDVEIEVNGLLTYDRAEIKVDVERAASAARDLR